MPPNYLEHNINDMSFWDEIIDFMAARQFTGVRLEVGDGIKWESHPEICDSNAWDKKTLDDVLSKFRAKGITPLPEINFAVTHDTWTKEYRRKISTPEYYKFVADIIAETAEVFDHPAQIALGMDEENPENQVWREMAIIRGEKLYWHDMYLMFDEVAKTGARPTVYGDYYWDHPDLFEKYMPKEVIIQNWFYNHFQNYEPDSYYGKALNTYSVLEKLGYDQIPICSTFMYRMNPEETLVNLKETISKKHLLGYETDIWTNMYWDDEFQLKYNLHRFFLARQKHYPETLKMPLDKSIKRSDIVM